ncbi:hypothetical protein A9G06_00825 [Aeromonas sp. DNP9]|nr:hypothetical protein A9G06_00825 [Aeromonas sp. DNP9]
MQTIFFHLSPSHPLPADKIVGLVPGEAPANMIRINVEALCTLQPRFADFSYAMTGFSSPPKKGERLGDGCRGRVTTYLLRAYAKKCVNPPFFACQGG